MRIHEQFVDHEEVRGMDDVRIPNSNIFKDGQLGQDCESVYLWLDKFININLGDDDNKIEVSEMHDQSMSRIEEIPAFDALYTRSGKGNDWLLFSRHCVGEEIDYELFDGKLAIKPTQFITISYLSPEHRSPVRLFVSSWREEHRSGTARFVQDTGSTSSCLVLSEKDGTMTEIKDQTLTIHDKYKGKAPSHTPEIQEDIEQCKRESQFLRQKFIDLVEYIKV